jgi:hypothetical protein
VECNSTLGPNRFDEVWKTGVSTRTCPRVSGKVVTRMGRTLSDRNAQTIAGALLEKSGSVSSTGVLE